MHQIGHKLLGTRLALREVLQAIATAARLTVDDVVQAGLGRPAPLGAQAASERVLALVPDGFAGLDAWPWCCPSCRRYVEELRSCLSARCATRACSACLDFYCKGCLAERASVVADAKQAASAAKGDAS